jgi:hypothetical protein
MGKRRQPGDMRLKVSSYDMARSGLRRVLVAARMVKGVERLETESPRSVLSSMLAVMPKLNRECP